MARFAHRVDVGVQQAALAEAAWGRKPNRYPVSGGALQRVELRAPIDQVRRIDGPLVVERVHRTQCTGFTYMNVRESRTNRSGAGRTEATAAGTYPRKSSSTALRNDAGSIAGNR